MTKDSRFSCIRIPIQFVSGTWVCAHGEPVPVKDGAHAELLIGSHLVTKPDFVAAYKVKEKYRILGEGSRLLITIMVKPEAPPPANLKHYLIPWRDIAHRVRPLDLFGVNFSVSHCIEVEIAGPSDSHRLELDTRDGGLWLLISGTRTKAIRSTTIRLPPDIGNRPARSLNHALTMLSEVFEQWRISHTGNIYERVFFKTHDEHWFPLAVLRESVVDEHEDLIAGRLRESVLERMNARGSRKRRR